MTAFLLTVRPGNVVFINFKISLLLLLLRLKWPLRKLTFLKELILASLVKWDWIPRVGEEVLVVFASDEGMVNLVNFFFKIYTSVLLSGIRLAVFKLVQTQ